MHLTLLIKISFEMAIRIGVFLNVVQPSTSMTLSCLFLAPGLGGGATASLVIGLFLLLLSLAAAGCRCARSRSRRARQAAAAKSTSRRHSVGFASPPPGGQATSPVSDSIEPSASRGTRPSGSTPGLTPPTVTVTEHVDPPGRRRSRGTLPAVSRSAHRSPEVAGRPGFLSALGIRFGHADKRASRDPHESSAPAAEASSAYLSESLASSSYNAASQSQSQSQFPSESQAY